MKNVTAGRLLHVDGIGSDEIAYNPAVIVQRNPNKIANGANIIAARVESLHSNWLDPTLYDPRIMFFTLETDILEPIPNTPVFLRYEDPWSTWIEIQGKLQLLFGGVKVDFSGKIPVITTRLHLAPSVQELDPNRLFTEIRGMKDIRVAQLGNGQIAVFTRPTTGDAIPGRIGFTIINSLQEIEKVDVNLPLLPISLQKEAKIGANEAFRIMKVESTGKTKEYIRVFCHVATTDPIIHEGQEIYDFERGIIHYGGYMFDLDPEHLLSSIELQKIADRSDFPANKISKGERFTDVIFPGGTGGADQTLYFTGVEDARIGVIDLEIEA